MPKLLIILALLFTLSCSTAPAHFSASEAQLRPKQDTRDGVKVWVNTASGVYHCPGSRWYGATKNGVYMTQKEAQERGNRPAYGRVCG